MVYRSPFPDLDIPQTNLLSYLFPHGETPDEAPLWIDADAPDTNHLSAAQALVWIRQLAGGLTGILQKGDVVLICTPNHIFVPVAYLAIVGGGFVFSGANPAYTEDELTHQLENTGAKALLVHPTLLDKALAAADRVGLGPKSIFQFSDREESTAKGVLDWRALTSSSKGTSKGSSKGTSKGTSDISSKVAYQFPTLSPHEATSLVATINYSSGTTGLPKGVCVSHANLIANVEQAMAMRYACKPYPMEKRPAERWLGFLPLYHAYGQQYTIVMAVKLRVPIYVLAEFRYEAFLDCIARFRITSLQIAPPILVMLSKRPETQRYDLRSVRSVLCGAAPLSRELQNACQDRFDMQINQGWGMTEVTCGALHVPGGVRDSTGSVGQLDPNCEARLVDDDGRDVAQGSPGELLIRGPNVCLGYWRNDAATREALSQDGWLRTGDIAVVNDQGYFWIVDRKKELIKVNALQVAPAELEGLLLEHDHVADAAVVGLKVSQEEERPRAYVVLHAFARDTTTPQSLQQWVAQRVAKHKHLTGGVVFVEEVPKLASGKIQRKTMRLWAQRDAEAIRAKL